MIHGYDAIYIFMLAAFTGYEVIGRVPVILHTPLMSGSNFVHGIVVVGAMVALGAAETNAQRAIGFIGVLLGAANAVGGYAVTDRMLEMFKSSRDQRGGRTGAAADDAADPGGGADRAGAQSPDQGGGSAVADVPGPATDGAVATLTGRTEPVPGDAAGSGAPGQTEPAPGDAAGADLTRARDSGGGDG